MRLITAFILVMFFVGGCDERSQTGADRDRAFLDRLMGEHEEDTPTPNVERIKGQVRAVSTSTEQYATIEGLPVYGFLAEPENPVSPPPGILVIHEWWGLNDNIRTMTENLAAQGYAALAVDLYRGDVAKNPEKARELMQMSMQHTESLNDNIKQAYAFLEARNSRKIGVLGWCFGGGWALNTALLFPEGIDAAVIFYGHLVQDRKQLNTLKMPILGIFAEYDQGIPRADVRAFQNSLAMLGKDADINIYPGVDHAFANPSGEKYEPRAAASAWTKTLQFLSKNLQ